MPSILQHSIPIAHLQQLQIVTSHHSVVDVMLIAGHCYGALLNARIPNYENSGLELSNDLSLSWENKRNYFFVLHSYMYDVEPDIKNHE